MSMNHNNDPMSTSSQQDASLRRALRSDWSRPSRVWSLVLGFIVFLLLSYSWMSFSITVPNERSRIYLSVALVDDHSVSIDNSMKRFGRMMDLAEYEGRYFSDKAPGSSLIGAVAYGLVRLFSEPEDWPIERLLRLMRNFVMIPFALVGFFLLRRLLHHLGLDPPEIDLASVGWMLGTAAFHYSQAFYGHQIVAVCLLGALYALVRAEERSQPRFDARFDAKRTAYLLLAGASAGLAGLTEFQAGVACVLLAVYLLTGPLRRRPDALVAFGLGALPFVAILLAYNNAAFGGPLQLSYHHLSAAALQEVHNQGIGGVTWPQWEFFKGGFFSLHRGLITTSPMFLLAFVGLWKMWSLGQRRLPLLLGAVCLYYIAFISSSNVWFAGWSFGPRLLVPAMGLATILVAFGIKAARDSVVGEVLARAAIIIGIITYQLVNAFFPEPPTNATNPVRDIVWPMFEAEIMTPNLFSTEHDGLTSLWPLAILVALVVIMILVRGMSRVPRIVAMGAMFFILVTCSLAAFTISKQEPGWSEAQQQSFLKNNRQWHQRDKRRDQSVLRRKAAEQAKDDGVLRFEVDR